MQLRLLPPCTPTSHLKSEAHTGDTFLQTAVAFLAGVSLELHQADRAILLRPCQNQQGKGAGAIACGGRVQGGTGGLPRAARKSSDFI